MFLVERELHYSPPLLFSPSHTPLLSSYCYTHISVHMLWVHPTESAVVCMCMVPRLTTLHWTASKGVLPWERWFSPSQQPLVASGFCLVGKDPVKLSPFLIWLLTLPFFWSSLCIHFQEKLSQCRLPGILACTVFPSFFLHVPEPPIQELWCRRMPWSWVPHDPWLSPLFSKPDYLGSVSVLRIGKESHRNSITGKQTWI